MTDVILPLHRTSPLASEKSARGRQSRLALTKLVLRVPRNRREVLFKALVAMSFTPSTATVSFIYLAMFDRSARVRTPCKRRAIDDVRDGVAALVVQP